MYINVIVLHFYYIMNKFFFVIEIIKYDEIIEKIYKSTIKSQKFTVKFNIFKNFTLF